MAALDFFGENFIEDDVKFDIPITDVKISDMGDKKNSFGKTFSLFINSFDKKNAKDKDEVDSIDSATSFEQYVSTRKKFSLQIYRYLSL